MREVLSGRKRLIKLKDLVPVNVPRLTEFHANKLYEMAVKDPQVKPYLPDPPLDSMRRPIGRKFLFNVSHSTATNLCPGDGND